MVEVEEEEEEEDEVAVVVVGGDGLEDLQEDLPILQGVATTPLGPIPL